MDATDFGGLVARAVAGLEQVRACLILSRDGLTLGAYPEGAQDVGRAAWTRLEALGEPERGFLVLGDELWVVARRGAYAGIVVASASGKAGLLLDRLEAALRAAEEARAQTSAAPVRPESPRRPRTPLHREPKPEPADDSVLEEMARAPVAPPPKEKEAVAPAPPVKIPEAEPPKAEPPRAEPPRAEPPKAEPPKAEPPKAEPPKAEPPKAEPPRLARPAPPQPSSTPRYQPSEPLLEGLDGGSNGDGPPVNGIPSPDQLGTEAGRTEPEGPEPAASTRKGSEDTEVDPVALAREFARLFDEGDEHA